MAGQARFHFKHFFRLNAQLMRDIRHLILRQGLHSRLHATQIEEQLALRLGRCHLDHAPVLQHILMNLGLDPVHCKRHQTHAMRRIKTFDCFHQADIAFLNQIGMRQAVAQITAGNRNHQAQVRKHQLTRRIKVFLFAKTPSQAKLFLFSQKRKLLRRLNISINIANRGDCWKSQSLCHLCLHLVTNCPVIILALHSPEC